MRFLVLHAHPSAARLALPSSRTSRCSIHSPHRPPLLPQKPSILLNRQKKHAINAAQSDEAVPDIAEVEALKGIRVEEEEDGRPRIEYLVKWKDGSDDTWEPASNRADNLLRDYEQRWWGAARNGNEETLNDMLAVGGPVLARTVDESRRSALHFAAALGRAQLVTNLLAAGAEVDLADKEGYTPLHMAAGYLHTSTISALLEGGADPEQKDKQARSPLELVESLRAALPPNNPATVARRVALEDVLKVLTDNLFEDVEPAAILDVRVPEDEEGVKREKEYLIRYSDDEAPEWVPMKYVSQEVIEDYEGGLEYAEAESIVDVRNRGDSRTYLVRWGDGYPDSWEAEENVSPDLIRIYEDKSRSGGGDLQLQQA